MKSRIQLSVIVFERSNLTLETNRRPAHRLDAELRFTGAFYAPPRLPRGWTNWTQMPSSCSGSNCYVALGPRSGMVIRVPLSPDGQRRQVAALYEETQTPAPFWGTATGFQVFRMLPAVLKKRVLYRSVGGRVHNSARASKIRRSLASAMSAELTGLSAKVANPQSGVSSTRSRPKRRIASCASSTISFTLSTCSNF